MTDLNDFYSEVKAEAHKKPNEEVCGFLLYDGAGSLRAYPSKNIASDPVNNFEIDGQDHLQAAKSGRLLGVYHSHVNCDHTFTQADKESATACALPFLVYSVVNDHFNWFKPCSAVKAFEGRPFVLLASDCAAIVEDYYIKYCGIRFPFMLRLPFNVTQGLAGIASMLLGEGFKEVKEPETHDIVLMSIAASTVNHAGIYVGDDVILHQVMGRVSSKTRYSESWRNATRFIFRKPKFTSKI